MKILVVEDNQIVRTAYVTLFSVLNYQVEYASDGLQALSMAKNKYDVILLDIHLPHINGVDVTLTLRRKKNIGNPYIIGITGDLSEELYKMCLQAGMNEVLHKPADPKKILEIINKHSNIEK